MTLSEGQDEDKGEITPLLRENKPKSSRGWGARSGLNRPH